MDVKLIITNILPDSFWGFSDLLDDLGPDATDDEKRAAILEFIHEDNWSVVDPDDGAIWTVSIDGDEPDWQARAEAAERHVQELKAQLAQAWRPVTEPPQMVDNYHVWRRPGYHDFCHFDGVNWRTTGGDSVTHWQPLPAPPQDTPASGRHEGEE